MCILIGDPCFLSYPFAFSQEATGEGILPERGTPSTHKDPEAEGMCRGFRIVLKEGPRGQVYIGSGPREKLVQPGRDRWRAPGKDSFDWFHHTKVPLGCY